MYFLIIIFLIIFLPEEYKWVLPVVIFSLIIHKRTVEYFETKIDELKAEIMEYKNQTRN